MLRLKSYTSEDRAFLSKSGETELQPWEVNHRKVIEWKIVKRKERKEEERWWMFYARHFNDTCRWFSKRVEEIKVGDKLLGLSDTINEVVEVLNQNKRKKTSEYKR